MYESPPPAPRPMSCPSCGHNVAETWASSLKSCQACGVELELDASPPVLVVAGLVVLFLLIGIVMTILIALAQRLPGGFLLPLVGGVAMFALYVWLLIKLTHRWGRLKVKS